MDIETKGDSRKIKTFTKQYLYDIVLQCPIKQIDKKLEYLEDHLFEITRCERHILKHKLSYFKSDFKSKWTAAHKKRDVFEKKNGTWLQGVIALPMMTLSLPRAGGRPSKSFVESSECTKRKKTKDLRERADPQQLTFAAQMSLRATGNVDASNIIKDIMKSPTRASKFRKRITKPYHIPQLSPTEALSMFVEGDLTRRQYNIVRNVDKQRFPCYSLLQKAKQQCYPKPDAFRVTSTCAEVKLQDVLDHTCSRLCQYLDEVFEECSEEERSNLELIHKWGCDGSKQSQFKQKFENTTDSDANIFQSSFVPLRLQTKEGKILWQNPVPSSPRYCRPIRIRYVHGTKDVTNDEINYVDSQIKDLQKSIVPFKTGTDIEVEHKSLFTMVDGKICNAATNTASTMRCYLCGLTSKSFNDLSKKKDVNPESLSLGISVLHAKIRLFESILHLSYKIPTGKWQTRSEEDKKTIAKTKKLIQDKFRQEMGLLVDIPKAGFGSTNDGNSARRFFQNPKLTSEITGVDETLIYRLKIILEAISSGHEINVAKFEKFTSETAQLYISLYSWHPMTPTMHKILVHGGQIISHAFLPIGQLSEEAAEARNKHFRTYRLGFARKFSREACNKDVIHRLLLSSDPLLTSIRPLPRKSTRPFSKETIDLLLPSKSATTSRQESSESENEDDESNEESSCDESE